MPRMRVWVCKVFWDSKLAKQYPRRLFVFGDNEVDWGTLGQTCIRGEPNAVGVPTQKRPASGDEAHWNDGEYTRNCDVINTAIAKLIKRLRSRDNNVTTVLVAQYHGNRIYHGIVLPKNGIGTGLSGLPWRAPKSFKYLQKSIRDLQRKVFRIQQ